MAEHGRRTSLGAWLGPLADRVTGGVIVVAADGAVRFADSTASQLLRAATEEDLQLAVDELQASLADRDRLETGARSSSTGLVVERQTSPDGSLLILREARQLEAADSDLLLANRMRSLENLYRVMAHDLRSPLQAVALNVDLIRQSAREAGLDGPHRERVETYLDAVQGEVSRLGRSIRSLLSQAGPGSRTRRPLDLRRVQREVATLVRPVARRKQVRVGLVLPRHAVTVVGHRDRIKQAVLNLAVNAIEASPRNGNLEFELHANGREARLEVRDDGPGIPHEIASRVFELHYTTKPTGTGIGLSVARSVCRAHGGELELHRRVPSGTIARMRLPLAGRE